MYVYILLLINLLIYANIVNVRTKITLNKRVGLLLYYCINSLFDIFLKPYEVPQGLNLYK